MWVAWGGSHEPPYPHTLPALQHSSTAAFLSSHATVVMLFSNVVACNNSPLLFSQLHVSNVGPSFLYPHQAVSSPVWLLQLVTSPVLNVWSAVCWNLNHSVWLWTCSWLGLSQTCRIIISGSLTDLQDDEGCCPPEFIGQSLSHVQVFVIPWTAAHQAFLSFTISQSWLKLMSIESMMPSNHLILSRLLLLLPPIFPSIRVFSSESALHIRLMYWSFSFSTRPSNEYSGLIPFRINWFDLLAVQGSLKGLLQHLSSEASILLCSAFFMVQISHPYMTTEKIIVLTIQTSVGKVMSLFFNMLSRFVIAFLPRS